MNCYLAIDIGASSGRHILGTLEDGKLQTEEIHRFENGLQEKDGHLCWDTKKLFDEILKGMKKAGELGYVPISVGIDTWGCDFVLLDADGKLLGHTVGYRDARTEGIPERTERLIGASELYARTGTLSSSINTIYQLAAMKEQEPDILQSADKMLMYPDYFGYLLTGTKVEEYTIATTTGLLNSKSKAWDDEVIEVMGLPKKIFGQIVFSGTRIGTLLPHIAKEVGYDTSVVVPASHDTASAVLALPEENGIFLSSGTWSLMGIVRERPDCSAIVRNLGFTNEGCFDGRIRMLKNIMGLWLIQNVRHETGDRYSFAELCEMAEASDCESVIDCSDARFLAPDNMTETIRDYCARTGQKVPEKTADIAAVIYRGLAKSYAKTVDELETLTGKKYDTISIIGGGSKASYLNRLTASYTGKKVYAGPSEATAVGNILAQMISAGELQSIDEARSCVRRSFDIAQISA